MQLFSSRGSPLGGRDAAHAQPELDILADVEPGHQSVFLEYHAAIGRLAEMKHDLASSERSWARAAELAPNDTSYRFQLALTRLTLNDPAKRAEALGVMAELQKDPAQRVAGEGS